MTENRVEKNQGMSLVELLVSVAVLGIAMIGILSLMNASSRYFTHSNREVEVQQELQTTFALVSNMIVDANAIDGVKNDSGKVIVTNKTKKYAIQLVGTNLYAKEYAASATVETSLATGDNQNLIAGHVTSFSVNTDHYYDGYVTVAMTSKYGTREASMSKNVFLRNTGKEASDFFGECDTEVSGSGNAITFTITQNTGNKIASGRKLLIRVKVASIANVSGISGSGVGSISYHYNKTTGIITIVASVSSSGWDDKGKVSVTVNMGGAVNKNDCRVLSISK